MIVIWGNPKEHGVMIYTRKVCGALPNYASCVPGTIKIGGIPDDRRQLPGCIMVDRIFNQNTNAVRFVIGEIIAYDYIT